MTAFVLVLGTMQFWVRNAKLSVKPQIPPGPGRLRKNSAGSVRAGCRAFGTFDAGGRWGRAELAVLFEVCVSFPKTQARRRFYEYAQA